MRRPATDDSAVEWFPPADASFTVEVRNQSAEPIGCNAARERSIPARGQLIGSAHLTIGKLHAVAAMIAEAPMHSVALNGEAAARATLIRRPGVRARRSCGSQHFWRFGLRRG